MLRTIAFIIIITVGIGAGFFSRFSALLVYLWFALFRPQEWVWTDISSLRLSLVLGSILVLPSLVSGLFPNLSHRLSLGALAFLLFALLAQTGAVDQAAGWQWLDFLARLILVCLLLVTIVNTRRRFVLAVAVIGGSFGFHSAKAGLASLMFGGVQFFAGLGGVFSDNNGYALGTVMVMPLLMATAQNLSKERPFERWVRVAFFLSVPLSGYTVVSLFSRGAFLALVAAVLTFLALQKRKVFAIAVMALLCVAALALVPLQSGYIERLRTIGSSEIDRSSGGRLHFWRVAIDMAVHRPLGVGLWNYEAEYDAYDSSAGQFGTRRSVHSSHFQVLAETGFLGALAWVGLFALAILTLWRIRRRGESPRLTTDEQHFLVTMSNGLIASIVAFLIGGSFLAMALNDLTWLTFSLVAALDRLSASMLAVQSTSLQAAAVTPQPAEA